jgi:hypothetical protein
MVAISNSHNTRHDAMRLIVARPCYPPVMNDQKDVALRVRSQLHWPRRYEPARA